MNIIKAVILAIIQGLTEFLPISSSGHLAIADKIISGDLGSLGQFTITVHFGTMMATIWVFWDEIIRLLKSLGTIPQAIKEKKWNDDLKMVMYIIIATIPTAIIGYFFNEQFEGFMNNLTLVGIMLLVTAVILFLTRFSQQGDKKEGKFGFLNSLWLGLAQTAAMMPGISRSGTTISTALFLKSDREFAGRASFLISLPAIIGANVYEFAKLRSQGVCPFGQGVWIQMAGFLVSFGIGLAALKLLLHLIKKGKFFYFSIYCLVLGITIIILSQTGVL